MRVSLAADNIYIKEEDLKTDHQLIEETKLQSIHELVSLTGWNMETHIYTGWNMETHIYTINGNNKFMMQIHSSIQLFKDTYFSADHFIGRLTLAIPYFRKCKVYKS